MSGQLAVLDLRPSKRPPPPPPPDTDMDAEEEEECLIHIPPARWTSTSVPGILVVRTAAPCSEARRGGATADSPRLWLKEFLNGSLDADLLRLWLATAKLVAWLIKVAGSSPLQRRRTCDAAVELRA
eukprot:1617300-Amphidinium_carterae.2